MLSHATVFRLGDVVEMYLRAPCTAEVEKRVVMVDNMLFGGVDVNEDCGFVEL